MTRLHAIFSGRLRIWWLHHGREAWSAGLLMALVGLFLLASSMDYHDALDAERTARQEAEDRLAHLKALHGVPNPAIVLEARTAERYGLRLADIANDLDIERWRAKGVR